MHSKIYRVKQLKLARRFKGYSHWDYFILSNLCCFYNWLILLNEHFMIYPSCFGFIFPAVFKKNVLFKLFFLNLEYFLVKICFWDWRNGKQVACLEESHMDDVTQVCFVQVSIANSCNSSSCNSSKEIARNIIQIECLHSFI